MIESVLRRRLKPIASRESRLRYRREMTVCWIVGAAAGSMLLGVHWFAQWFSPVAVGIIGAAALLRALCVAWKSLHRAEVDYLEIARKIEHHHPELRALLLAAVEQQPQGPDSQLGYLQERVIQEAIDHAKKHHWVQTVPPSKLQLAWFGQLTAFTVFAVVLMLLLRPVLSSDDPAVARDDAQLDEAPAAYRVSVSPRDTTVEKGTGLVVQATFDGLLPPDAFLVFGPAGQSQHRSRLDKNLSDPVFGGTISEIYTDLVYHVEYDGERSKDYKITVYTHPSLERADAKILPPAYTELPETFHKDTRRVSMVEQSELTMTFHLNKPVTRARLLGKDESVMNLKPDKTHPEIVNITFKPERSQRYELLLVDSDGRKNKVPPRFVVEVHKNMPPTLKNVFPGRDTQVSPLEEVTIKAEAADDYGLKAIGLSYSIGGSLAKEIPLEKLGKFTMKQQTDYLLALETLEAEPDQLISYFFWAEDLGPDGKARRTSSDMYYAEVRHFEEIFREGQAPQGRGKGKPKQKQAGEKLAELQKQIINATWKLKRQTVQESENPKFVEDTQVVRQGQADALDLAKEAQSKVKDSEALSALKTAIKHMSEALSHLTRASEPKPEALTPALSAEQEAYQALLKLRAREHKIARGKSKSPSQGAAGQKKQMQLAQLELKQKEKRYETERTALSRQQVTQRENLQVLNRLRELAQRQNDLSKKLKELQKPTTPSEEEDLQRELKRLRQEQQKILRDVDELRQRMEQPNNRGRLAQERKELDQTRQRVRQASESLDKGKTSKAITSATRAQRQLQQLRDSFRLKTASRFADQMRRMRSDARNLAKEQKQIAEEIQKQVQSRRKTLTDRGAGKELANRTEKQKNKVDSLVEQMRKVTEQAELAEPLLSRKLYETLRKTETNHVGEALRQTRELLQRNFLPQAQNTERKARKGIEDLKRGIEVAAESVLGNETESLRLAKSELDDLIKQVYQENRRSHGAPRRPPPGGKQQDAKRPASKSNLPDAKSQPKGSPSGKAKQNSRKSNSQQKGAPSANSTARADSVDSELEKLFNTANRPGLRFFDQLGSNAPQGPITGKDFRRWSDRLRDLEEILDQPMRIQLSKIRDRARALRAEFKRHGKMPQWDQVKNRISDPLVELRDLVAEALARGVSDEAMVPIDRDPVPSQFKELVRRYYEKLGSGK